MEAGRRVVMLEHHIVWQQRRPWRSGSAAPQSAVLFATAHSAFCSTRTKLWRSSAKASRDIVAAGALCLALGASSSSSTADFDDQRSVEAPQAREDDRDATTPEKVSARYVQAAGIISGITLVGTIAAITFTLAKGGPAALAAAISKSGFYAAFALIFVSEIGDKTFFIAALLAMRHSRGLVLLGSMGALSLMTVISVVIGRLFQRVPAQLQTTLPVGEYAAVTLLVLFGLKAIKEAWDLPSAPAKDAASAGSDSGELAEAQEAVKKVEGDKALSTPLTILGETFSLVFLAEWGDRSMLATVALGAAQSPWGVASGAILGHTLATLLAILGGAFLARYISEKVVGYIGGVLFLVFAAATLLGVF